MKPFRLPIVSEIMARLLASSKIIFLLFSLSLLLAAAFRLYSGFNYNFELAIVDNVSGVSSESVVLYYSKSGALSEESKALVAIPARLSNETQYHSVRLFVPWSEIADRKTPFARFDPVGGAIGTISIRRSCIGVGIFACVFKLDLEGLPKSNLTTISRERGTLLMRVDDSDPRIHLERKPLAPLIVFAIFDGIYRAIVILALGIALILLVHYFAKFLRHDLDGKAHVRSPLIVLLAVALLGVVLSEYPILFFGKSHFSPHYGALLYIEAPSVFGAHHLGSERVFTDSGAGLWQSLSFARIQVEAVFNEGVFPIWDRYSSFGGPMLGSGDSFIFDPLHWIVIFSKGNAWGWDAKFILGKLIYALGIGFVVFQLTRLLSISAVICYIAPFTSFFIYRFNHPTYGTLVYAPWILVGWILFTQRTDFRGRGYAAILMAVTTVLHMNSGTSKEAVATVLVIHVTGLIVFFCYSSALSRLSTWLVLFFSGVTTVLLTAPYVITFLVSLGVAETNYDIPSADYANFQNFLYYADSAFSGEMQLVGPLNMGWVVFVGIIIGLFSVGERRSVQGYWPILGSALLFSAVLFGFVPNALILSLPFIRNIIHIDTTFFSSMLPIFTVFAGLGYAVFARAPPATRQRASFLVTIAILLFVLESLLAVRKNASIFDFNPNFVFGIIFLACALPWSLSMIVSPPGSKGISRAVVLVLFSTVFLVLPLRNGYHVKDPAHPLWGNFKFDHGFFNPLDREDLLLEANSIRRVHELQLADGRPSRVAGLHGVLFPGHSGFWKLESINGPAALKSPYVTELLDSSGFGFWNNWNWLRLLTPAHIDDIDGNINKLLDFLNVGYVLNNPRESYADSASTKLVAKLDLDVRARPRVWPRAFFTDRILSYSTAKELSGDILNNDGKPFAALQKSGKGSALSRLGQDLLAEFDSKRFRDRSVVPAENYRLGNSTTKFTVDAPGPGIAVLTEAYWGLFRARVNGMPAEIVRSNHAFQGVEIPEAGHYEVEVYYANWPWTVSWIAGLLGCFLLASWFVILLWRDREIRS